MSIINCETDDQVAIITINRPEVRNAIDCPAAEALAEAFRRFDVDDSLGVAVLTGRTAFSARAPISRLSPAGEAITLRPRVTVRSDAHGCCSPSL